MSKEPEEFKEPDVSETDNEPDAVTEPESSETTETKEEPELTEQSEEPDESETEDTEAAESSEGSSEETDAVKTETAEDAEETDAAEGSAEDPENAPLNDKILAIKSAIEQQERKLEIADKVKKYKNVTGNGDQPENDTPVKTAEISDTAPVKKKSKKNSKKKKTRKKQKQSLFPRKGDKPLEVLRKCIFLASAAVFVVCLSLLVEYFWNNQRNSSLNSELDKMYQETLPAVPEETTAPTEEEYEYFGYLPNVESLLAINPDVVGWISIPGTDISYPVLQRRGNDDGNEYYLKRNIYLEDAHAGSIFMDYRNDFDYVIDGKKQLANSGNLIIYGHNMHDYTMFGSLKHYINDANYYSEHPIVELNSNYRKYKYKIFAMIIVDIDDQTDTRFDYWNKLEFADERDFYDYVNEIKRRTIRLNDVDVKYGDELLTLSTCNSTFSDGRLVVFARKLRDDEDLISGTETSTANPNVKWPNSYYRWNRKTYDPEAEFVPYG